VTFSAYQILSRLIKPEQSAQVFAELSDSVAACSWIVLGVVGS